MPFPPLGNFRASGSIWSHIPFVILHIISIQLLLTLPFYFNICHWRWVVPVENVEIFYSNISGGSDCKESASSAGDMGLIPGQEDPVEKEWLSTPVFLPAEHHGQRSLAGTAQGVTKSQTSLSNSHHSIFKKGQRAESSQGQWGVVFEQSACCLSRLSSMLSTCSNAQYLTGDPLLFDTEATNSRFGRGCERAFTLNNDRGV